MLTTLIGDIHENSKKFNPNFMPDNSIQLGDLALGYGKWLANARLHKCQGWQVQKRFFIDGNHENFSFLNCDANAPYEVVQGLYHIPRGFTHGSVGFIGGANSIDKDQRTAGIDWFAQEAISQAQFNRIADKWENATIDVVLAHDLPACAYPSIGIDEPMSNTLALQGLFEIAKPSAWICAHHHISAQFKVDGCDFRILNTNEKMEIDLPWETPFPIETDPYRFPF